MTSNPGGDVTNGSTIFISEPGFGEKRYLVLPVFIHNCLDSLTSENIVGNSGEKIYSFRFQMQYNNCMLRAVGVSKRGALPQDTNVLARQFNLSWEVHQEPNYKFPTTGGSSAFGERVTVTGSSSLPLPRSPEANAGIPNPTCQDRDYTPLIYVIFEVVGDAQGGTCGITADQMIINRDSIRWNNYDPSNVTPEMIARGFDPVQTAVFPRPVFPITYPNDYGSATIQITRRPRIDLQPSSQIVLSVPGDFTDYEVVFPLQTQFGNSNRIFRELQLQNGVAGSFLRNLIIETDQPWLRIDTNVVNTPPGVGQGGTNGERGMIIRNVGAQLPFNIVANPNMLPAPPNSYPTPGIYVGYITIRSTDAQNSSVRVRVVLIVNRNPLESSLDTSTEPINTRGIFLMFRNSRLIQDTIHPDTTYLTFGTGVGATDGVDSLFGELEAADPPLAGSFYARFFPPSLTGFNGMIDGRGLYTTEGRRPEATNGEASIDIRNYEAQTIHTYCVNFDAGDPADYPVVIEYDTLEFPEGAQLFFRQNVGGIDQTTNMRTEGARIGSSRRAIFIEDPSITSFCIDYLLPGVVQFPELNRGWNLVSLPVEPSDPDADVVFKNSSSGPILFTQNQYTRVDEVHAGYGYFVKYGDILDLTVSGSPVMLINELLTPHRIRVYEGWNTVGALSVPTEVSMMDFGPYEGNTEPDLDGEVYRYITSKGYEQASRIIPGYGYWIKVTGAGWYRLAPLPKAVVGEGEPAKPYTALNNLTIADNEQKGNSQLWFGNGTVNEAQYEMPPAPTSDLMFDARFDNNGFVSSSLEPSAEHVVELQGVSFPVVLSVDNADATYLVSDVETGALLGQFTAGEASAIRVNNPMVKSVKLTRVPSPTIDLSAAYPNPTSDRLSFDIAVPSERVVSVALFNSYGEKVADLFAGSIESSKTIEYSTKGLSAGVYVYKMTTANGETVARQVVVSR